MSFQQNPTKQIMLHIVFWNFSTIKYDCAQV